jgi:predicted Zn-dependent protease
VITACEKAKVIGAGFHQARGAAGASATKNGNFIYEQSSLVSLATTARTPDGTSSGYFLRNHFDVAKLDTARIANEAIRKALDARNPRVLEPGVYPAILEPQAAADLLGFFTFSFDARSAEEGRSPFSAPGGKTKVGEKICDERINIYSDPWHPELPGSQSAQAGLPAQKSSSCAMAFWKISLTHASGPNKKAKNRRLDQSTASWRALSQQLQSAT